MNSETIKIKYIDDMMPKLDYIDGEKSEWIDLRSAEDVEMEAGEFRLINLGVAMKLPEGYEANIAPRSSTFKKFGIIQANHFGVIDNSYCGDNDYWMYPAIALRPTKIYKGYRICQFRIQKIQPRITFEEVSKLDAPDRGGFGTTGVK